MNALRIFDEEITKIQQEEVQEKEIERAIQQAEAMFAYGSENITNQAFWMGYSSIFADYSWYANYLQRLRAVSSSDIQGFAQAQFAPKNRTVGIFIPTQERK